MPKIDNVVDINVILTDLLLHEYKLINILDKNKPIAANGLIKAFDLYTHSHFEDSVDVFLKNSIKDIYGISLKEFQSYSMDKIKILVKKAGEVLKDKKQAVKNIQDELEKK